MDRRGFFHRGAMLITFTVMGRPAQAESPRAIKIAFVTPSAASRRFDDTRRDWMPFFAIMREHGFVLDRNLTTELVTSRGSSERMPELIVQLVARKPDLIIVSSTRTALQVKDATSTIPIICVGNDPVALGLVPSLAGIVGNITGVIPDGGLSLFGRQLQLLREIRSDIRDVSVLVPNAAWVGGFNRAFEADAPRLGITIRPQLLQSPIDPAEISRGVNALLQRKPDALVVSNSPEFYALQSEVAKSIDFLEIPAVYPDRTFVQAGGLISYGVDFARLFTQIGRMAREILEGTDAGRVPFYQATHFECFANLSTARLLGLEFGPALLAQIDETID